MKQEKIKKPFLIYYESDTQYMAQRVIHRKLSADEIRYLKAKTITEIQNLLIKINSSGIK